jgi:pyruvate ferredoxin oxidoreductase gamma subunit/2-oxoisovalerate ferredoxin oxidoreductase gamma subunit
MVEIRFHGRGGQGTVVAGILLAKAFFRAGYYVQSFPLFGVERRGAPVEAYVRLDREEILLRNNSFTPDHVVVLATTLLEGIDVTRGLKPGGWILLNSPDSCADDQRFSNFRLACVDATEIALSRELGTHTHPIVNTAMAGALARILGAPPLDAVYGAIEEEISEKPAVNIEAAREAYERVAEMKRS